MTEDIKKEIVELLENLPYWDTCPQNYKDKIPTLVEALKQRQTSPIDNHLIKVEKAYIEDAEPVGSYDVTGRTSQVWITKEDFDEIKCINN